MKKLFFTTILWVVFSTSYFLKIHFLENFPDFIVPLIEFVILSSIALATLAIGQIARYVFCTISGIGNGSICFFPLIFPSPVHRRLGFIIHNECLYRYTISQKVACSWMDHQNQEQAKVLELYRKSVGIQFLARFIPIIIIFVLSLVRGDFFLSFLCIYSLYVNVVLSQAKGKTYIGELVLYHEIKDMDSEFCNNFFMEQIALYFLTDSKYFTYFEKTIQASDMKTDYTANALFYYYFTLIYQKKMSSEEVEEYMQRCIYSWVEDILPATPQWYCICMYIVYCLEYNLEKEINRITALVEKEISRIIEVFPLQRIRNLQINTLKRLCSVLNEKKIPEQYKRGFYFRNYYCRISDDYKKAYNIMLKANSSQKATSS